MKRILFVVLFIVCMTCANRFASAQVLVIANPKIGINAISKNDLRQIFIGGESNLGELLHLVPILMKTGDANDKFLSLYVGKTDSAFKASWRSLVFSGHASMPKYLDSEADMIDFIAHNTDAIGYVGATTAHPGVKVLAVK